MQQSQSSMCISSFPYFYNVKTNDTSFLRPITNGKLSHSFSSTFCQHKQKTSLNPFSPSALKNSPPISSSNTNLLIEASKLNKSISSHNRFDQQKQLIKMFNIHKQTHQHSQFSQNQSTSQKEENKFDMMSHLSRHDSFNHQYELNQQNKSFLLSDLSSLGAVGSNLNEKKNEQNPF
jgi:hypothetical protein